MLVAQGEAVPRWLIDGHSHLKILSILVIVIGFTIPELELEGRLRTAVTGLFVVGQWGLR